MHVVECTIPAHMTIEQWRRVERKAECGHLHDTTTRYDHDAKRLDFYLVCPVCRTAKLVHSMDYEPRFEPLEATVHALRPREPARPRRRAA
jgi:hypothetical protein